MTRPTFVTSQQSDEDDAGNGDGKCPAQNAVTDTSGTSSIADVAADRGAADRPSTPDSTGIESVPRRPRRGAAAAAAGSIGKNNKKSQAGVSVALEVRTHVHVCVVVGFVVRKRGWLGGCESGVARALSYECPVFCVSVRW